MNLDDRVRRLEAERRAMRCDKCRNRNEYPVYRGDFPEGGKAALPEACQACPACGWEPTIIHIIRTEEAAKL